MPDFTTTENVIRERFSHPFENSEYINGSLTSAVRRLTELLSMPQRTARDMDQLMFTLTQLQQRIKLTQDAILKK